MSDNITRRRFASGAAAAATVALAGCSGNDGSDGSDGGSDGADSDGGSTDDGMGDGSGDSTESVTVGPGGDLVFDPDSLEVTAGTTVEFTWDSAGHNINVDSQPDGAEWSGVDELQSEGFTHEHTFEVAGEYDYFCEPHQGSGMVGSITVTES